MRNNSTKWLGNLLPSKLASVHVALVRSKEAQNVGSSYETLQRSSSGPLRPYGKREDPGDEVGLSRANASARENQPTRGVISRALAFRSLHYP